MNARGAMLSGRLLFDVIRLFNIARRGCIQNLMRALSLKDFLTPLPLHFLFKAVVVSITNNIDAIVIIILRFATLCAWTSR